ncbi:MAG: hypothetical protein HOP15_02785 [Planctomycetes bacterium]|nr:hypothetical protein [Planctomycetota bacterium]
MAAPDPAREIRELITALTPPPATAIPVLKSEFFSNKKAALERLRLASPAHGLEALRVYREERPTLPEVQSGLLDIAAHTNPPATEELLVKLTTTFGEDLYVRKQAAKLLGKSAPIRAIDVIEPILRGKFDDRTYPPEESLLEAWLTAHETLELDPVPLLALVATDIKRPMDVRHAATKALGRHPSPLSRQALETILVESSGNGYIRRLALQALSASLPREEFCALALKVQDREADTEFVMVLEDHLVKSCR